MIIRRHSSQLGPYLGPSKKQMVGHGPAKISLMPLNHTKLQALKPESKSYVRTDRDGLFIEVLPTGKMVWRYKFHFGGKRPRLTIGPYPEIGLADARSRRDAAAALLANGINPAAEKQVAKLQRKAEQARAFNFEKLAEKWFADDISHMSEKWQYTVRNWLKLDILPALGGLDPREILPQSVRDLLNKIVARGSPNSANKVRLIVWKIFEYGIERDELEDRNPVARIKAVRVPETVSHRPLSASEIKPFFDALQSDSTRIVNKIAIEMLMLTLTRKDELRLAKWSEFDFEALVWRIPAHRMKMGGQHEVYLSSQVLSLLEQLKEFSRDDGFILPGISSRSKAIGHTTLNSVIDRLDIDGARFVPHGFRATASTLLNNAKFSKDAIERQLAHKEPNRVRAIYNHAEYADERREMLQCWADYLSDLRAGDVAILKRKNNA